MCVCVCVCVSVCMCEYVQEILNLALWICATGKACNFVAKEDLATHVEEFFFHFFSHLREVGT